MNEPDLRDEKEGEEDEDGVEGEEGARMKLKKKKAWGERESRNLVGLSETGSESMREEEE